MGEQGFRLGGEEVITLEKWAACAMFFLANCENALGWNATALVLVIQQPPAEVRDIRCDMFPSVAQIWRVDQLLALRTGPTRVITRRVAQCQPPLRLSGVPGVFDDKSAMIERPHGAPTVFRNPDDPSISEKHDELRIERRHLDPLHISDFLVSASDSAAVLLKFSVNRMPGIALVL